MDYYRVLIVEDERIVARDLRDSLEGLGYEVVDMVTTGQEAIEVTGEERPNLVLMDIILKGEMDGIEASREIRGRYDIPVVYLTAHTDISTVDRVKETEPYGYVVKPFRIGELRSVIEIAVHKHSSERKLKEESESIASLLSVVGSGIMTIDGGGVVRYMNPLAEEITGVSRDKAIGSVLNEVLRPVDGKISGAGEMVNFAFEDGEGIGRYDDVLIELPDGSGKRIDIHLMRLEDVEEGISGVALLFTEAGAGGSEEILSLYGAGRDKGEIGLIVAGSSLVREGIRGVLRGVEGVRIVSEVSGRDELSRVLEGSRADILFIDSLMLGDNAGEVLDEIEKAVEGLKTVLFVHEVDEKFIRSCIARGVNGFITDNSAGDIPNAIASVINDKFWMEQNLFSSLLGSNQYDLRRGFSGSINLTKKERAVMELAIKGYSNKQISQELYLSENTVKTHMKKIFRKVGVKKRSDLILLS